MFKRFHKNCRNCPRATLKLDPNTKKNFMYCQTERSCIQLREGWGDKSVPIWCPRLERDNFPYSKLLSNITRIFTKR